jgi:glycosyltransferase involved in cell wall biosynthesis
MQRRVKTISIVTPCLNAERYIAETIASVLAQNALHSGRVKLDYWVVDGRSNDRTLEIVRAFGSPAISILSESDSGMYEALAHGLLRTSGEWVAYLNAGDLYSPHAFDILLDVVEEHDEKWVSGMIALHGDQGYLIDAVVPYRFRRSLIRSGQYSRRPPFFLPWIQQESIFWESSLTRLIDFEHLSRFRYAGDAFLWYCFATEYDLRIISGYMGGFRRHVGQLSENRTAYMRELRSFADRPRLRDLGAALIDNLLWYAPLRLKKYCNPRGLYCYDHRHRKWA